MLRNTLALAALSAVALSGPAMAHAFLTHASPKVGSRAPTAPAEVRLSFSEPVEAALSAVTVVGPPGFGGASPPKGGPNDPRVLIAPFHGLAPPGRYAVHWRVVSGDNHATQGDFQFEITP